jgi:hypothetical protein
VKRFRSTRREAIDCRRSRAREPPVAVDLTGEVYDVACYSIMVS